MNAASTAGGPVSVGRVLGVEPQPIGPLSVADVQQVMRHLLGRQASTARGDNFSDPASTTDVTPAVNSTDAHEQVSVIAGHPGAGSSTVALAVADAAAASGRVVHLLDPAAPGRSGLVAASSTELGTDPTGAWQRGRRTSVLIERRALLDGSRRTEVADLPPDGLTVLDLGSVESQTANGSPTIVVCRANVPGVRLVEERLRQLAERPLLVAAVGPHGWAREVRSTVGPVLNTLRSTGLVVSVPWDARLDVTGLTDRPLPRALVAAGAQLLSLLHTAGHLHQGASGRQRHQVDGASK